MDANHRKKLSATLALLLLASEPAFAAGLEAQKSEAIQQKNAIQSEMSDARSKIQSTRGAVSSVEAEIRAIDARISQANVELDRLNGEMAQLKAEIQKTKEELEAAKQELAEKKEFYAKRLRAMYIANDRGYLDILLDSADAESLIGNARMIRSIAKSDRELVDEITAKVQEIEEKQAILAQQEQELAAKQQQVQQQRASLESANAQKTTYMNGLIGNLSAYEAQYDQMLRESDAIESKIANLEYSIQKAREEEAARVARQNAAKEAAKAERQKAKNQQKATAQSEQTPSASVEAEAPVRSESVATTGSKTEAETVRTPAPVKKTYTPRPVAPAEDAVVSNGIVAEPEAPKGDLYWPVPGHHRVSSPFGYRTHPILGYKKMHTGIDIPAPSGTPVVSAASGTVIASRFMSGYGNCVMVDHGSKVTVYAHLSSRAVHVGQTVSGGETIAYVGSTGMSTGPHLHFEVRVGGVVRDPLNYL